MLVGVVTGTYSTVFIASTIAIILSRRESRRPGRGAREGGGAGVGQAAQAWSQRPRILTFAETTWRRPGFSGRRRARPLHDVPASCAARRRPGPRRVSPDSSSAHLILARLFFGFDGDRFGLPFDVACHLGTLLAIFAYFRHDLLRMIAAAPRLLSPAWRDDPAARLDWLVILGTLPVVVVGLALRNAEDALRTPAVAAATLAIGGVLLLVAERVARRTRLAEDLGPAEAVGLGIAQSAALVPGVSRSGATITLGLMLGLRRDAAARFSFLLGLAGHRCRGGRNETLKLIDAGAAEPGRDR